MHVIELVGKIESSRKLERREDAPVHDGEHDGICICEPWPERLCHAIERAGNVARGEESARRR